MELSAENVWSIVASAMVLLMTPSLAFFYSGMTRAKAALNMMMMSFIAMGLVGVIWVLWGYSMSIEPALIPEIVGSPFSNFGVMQLLHDSPEQLLTVGFSSTFAIIAVAIISGSVADRAKFSAWIAFVPLWITLVYCPLAFMVWGGGLFSDEGLIGSAFGEAIDFAGGLVIHINAGVAGLVLAVILGARQGFGKDPNHRPHNLPFVMLGVAVLWFGWFGFNAGAADSVVQAGLIWINTLVTPGAAMLGWTALERFRDGHATSLGGASGIVAGLVAITPACPNIAPIWAIVLGLISGVASAYAVGLKYKWGYDDSLDVVGVHLVSGIIGTLALGFVATPDTGQAGLFYGGGFGLLVTQTVATILSMIFSAVMTLAIAYLVHRTIGFRVSEKQEIQGIDLAQHAETAYSFASGTSGNFLKSLGE